MFGRECPKSARIRTEKTKKTGFLSPGYRYMTPLKAAEDLLKVMKVLLPGT